MHINNFDANINQFECNKDSDGVDGSGTYTHWLAGSHEKPVRVKGVTFMHKCPGKLKMQLKNVVTFGGECESFIVLLCKVHTLFASIPFSLTQKFTISNTSYISLEMCE